MELAPTRQAERLNEPLPLTELVEVAEAARRHCEDYPHIPLRSTRVQEDGSWRFDGTAGRLSRHALGQLCARINLPGGGSPPAGYFARCPSALAAEHLNYWLYQGVPEDQRVLVRTRNGDGSSRLTVRAVLSDRYATVDHGPLLETLRDLVPQHGLQVQSWSLDDEQLVLRLQEQRDHPASLKDPLRVGLQVTNSEVGLGRISIHALITRLVCTNGLVVKVADLGGIHRRHIGRAGESLQDVVLRGLPQVLSEADEAARRFVNLRSRPAPEPVEPYLDRLAKEAELPEETAPQLRTLLEGETLYDVANAFTRLAQGLPLSERVRVEAFTAGRFLREHAN